MGLTSKPTPHPTPLDDDPLECLRLIRSRRVGAVTWHRLVGDHGSVAAALAALPDVARAAGVENYAPCPAEVARHELAAGRAAGARLICFGAPEYPALLAELPDAPPVLWCLGDAGLMARQAVAVVGARNASSLGLRMARRLAEGLGQAGLVSLSGLARGIDAEVHRATLETGTVGVLAGGVDVPYPDENAPLYDALRDRGCLISEQPMGMAPQARHFPLRNRIISGLARAVVVVEAATRSGSLLTARAALDQGREVLAVPGHPFDARAGGCNQLIRDGATLVRGPADVLEALDLPRGAALTPVPVAEDPPAPPLPGPSPARRPLADHAALHAQILARLGPSPLAEDQLIRDLSLPPAAVTAGLVTLELEGRVLRAAGGMVARAE